MHNRLDTLELTPRELEIAREEVRRLAYRRWCEAGYPLGDGAPFWLAAEEDWIGRCYTPHRSLEYNGCDAEHSPRSEPRSICVASCAT